MSEKRVEITNVLCRQVQLLIKGGATNKEAGSLVGVSAATVSRIRTANYDPFKYQQNTEARRKLEVEVADAMDYISQEEQKDEDQVPGQMKMDLPEEEKETTDQTKMMRFLAAKIGEVTTKLDKLNDNLCKILRRMDKC